jgi:amidase
VAHGDFKYVGYTGVYNVVDYSAVSFPTGIRVDKAKDKLVSEVKAQSEYCQAARDSCKLYGLIVRIARQSANTT